MSNPSNFSRRRLICGIALSVAAAATAVPAMADQAKRPQKAVDYRDVAQGSSRCDNCKYFRAPAACLVVDGTIAPGGWCNMYLKKDA